MEQILIYGGTTEGRELALRLAQCGIPACVNVATEYGQDVMPQHPLIQLHTGRMDEEQMVAQIKSGMYLAVVDATHPYAVEVTANIRKAAGEVGLPYLRLLRDNVTCLEGTDVTTYASQEDCARALCETEGNILLTTGSKELKVYAEKEELRARLYVRVLPNVESLEICRDLGLAGKQILAAQGPFDTEFNLALIHQYNITILVTKESGSTGGYPEKLEAVRQAEISLWQIGRQAEKSGLTFTEVCKRLEEILQISLKGDGARTITLVGTGMGTEQTLTKEAREAIATADIILGAERLIAPYRARLDQQPIYTLEQILPYLKNLQQQYAYENPRNVVILFSGDCGFYSGAEKLYQGLCKAYEAEKEPVKIRILPGISSMAYLSALTGIAYQDAQILSLHGKSEPDLFEKLQGAAKTFLLTSGPEDIQAIGRMLCANQPESYRLYVGYRMSYPDQTLQVLTPKQCLEVNAPGLYTCLICNENPKLPNRVLRMRDTEWIRELGDGGRRVPMTKEEARLLGIAKLELKADSTLYDIGCGTGSIGIQAARMYPGAQIYGIERRKDAVSLIKENVAKFAVANVTVVEGEAPKALEPLPVPTHAVIGGSGGKLSAILDTLTAKNPKMRISVHMVTAETVAELTNALKNRAHHDEEWIQLHIDRAQQVGDYHIMKAENPVWICTFTLGEIPCE